MLNDGTLSHYDILEIQPNSSEQEIRQAYLKLKLAYSKESVALYSLVSPEDTRDILKKIEEAYNVLSHDERRREYDRQYAQVGLSESPFAPQNAGKPVVSIDRTPPMEKNSRVEDVLVAPITDFAVTAAAAMAAGPAEETLGLAPVAQIPGVQGRHDTAMVSGFGTEARRASGDGLVYTAPEGPEYGQSQTSYSPPASVFSTTQTILQGREIKAPDACDPVILAEIEKEVDWSGQFIRKVREARTVTIEELSLYTKISKTYLHAIENEDFPKLPASTFVRGFMIQIAKRLKLPHDKVAAAYVSRYRKACPEKS
jgi:hypothetical protein